MDNKFNYICLCVYEKSLMEDFVKKLSKKGYIPYPNIEKDKYITSTYDEKKYNKIVINVRGIGSNLPLKNYWFFDSKKDKQFWETQKEIKKTDFFYNRDFLEIFIHDRTSKEVIQKVNEIFQKEFGFTLRYEKTIINYI